MIMTWLTFCAFILGIIHYLTLNAKKNLGSINKHLVAWFTGLTLVGWFMLSPNFMLLFCTLVGFSLGIYVFVLSKFNHHTARESGSKYFYLSAVSAGLILFGVLMYYLVFGHIQIENSITKNTSTVAVLLTFLLFGLMFKLAAYPGHLWAADVYEGSRNAVLGFFVLPSKIAVLVVFSYVLVRSFGETTNQWLYILILGCLGSTMWGALAAIFERKIRRFLAYTSINQMGFLLIGLVLNGENYKYTLLYLVIYASVSLLFMAVFLRIKPSPVYITDLNGYAKNNPLSALVLCLALFAMAGIPPLIGFWGKYSALLAAFNAEYVWLVKIILLFNIISVGYYIRLVKTMYFESLRTNRILTSTVPTVVVVSLAAFTIIGFTMFDALIRFAETGI